MAWLFIDQRRGLRSGQVIMWLDSLLKKSSDGIGSQGQVWEDTGFHQSATDEIHIVLEKLAGRDFIQLICISYLSG